MKKITDFIENIIAPPLTRLAETRYLQAIQKTFMMTMPLLMFSSFFILIAALPIPGWSGIVGPIIGPLWGGVNSTLGYIGLLVALLNGYYLGEHYNHNDKNVSPIATSVMSLIAFLIFFPMFTTENGVTAIATANFGSTGIFTALLASIIAVEVYRFLIAKNITIKMPEGVPPMVVDAFTSLIPSFAVMFLAWLFSFIFKLDLPGLMNSLFAPLVAAGSGPIAQFISFFIDRILWFTGIHGSNVVSSVMSPVWINMIAKNIEAYQAGNVIPYLFTAEWCNYFIRISVFPIALLASISTVKRYKTLGRLALPASIFNIAEPVMFGLPIILNPILFIPWVFGFSFLWLWTYIFTVLVPILPPIIAQVAWTVPAPISAYLATGGSIIALLFSLLNYVILGLIFLPFFKVLEKQEREKENSASKE